MTGIKTTDAQLSLATIFRERATEAAGGNTLVSKTEQGALPDYLRRVADLIRVDKGKGASVVVDELVDRAMTLAMTSWEVHNPPNNGRDSKYLSLAEAKAVQGDDASLGCLTLLAREMAASGKAGDAAVTAPGLPVTMKTDHPSAKLEATATGYRLSSDKSGDPDTLGFTPTVTLSFGGKSLVLKAESNGQFMPHHVQEKMPAGYWFTSIDDDFGETHVATFVIEKAPANALKVSQAIPLARKALVDHLQSGRTLENDWTHELGKPSSWPELVADGIMTGINGFGTAHYTEILDEGRQITIAGPGPYGLYSEVTLDKRTREAVRAYVEID